MPSVRRASSWAAWSAWTREFLTYEKLPPGEENAAQLEMRPHPGATIWDPDAPQP
jgi:hypothetical protein